MQGAYPELVDSAARVAKVVEAEEKQFDRVLKIGLTRSTKSCKAASPAKRPFTSTRPSACRSTSWSMPLAMPECV